MSFIPFENGWDLRRIRTGSLNPLIEYVNTTLTPDVSKLKSDLVAEQAKTSVAYKKATLDVAGSKLAFTRLDDSIEDVDITPLIDMMNHGIFVGDKNNPSTVRYPRLEFDGANISIDPTKPDTVIISYPEPEAIYGDTSGTRQKINTIALSGNKGASNIVDGVMTIELPTPGGTPTPTDPIKGEIKDEGPKDLKLVKVIGVTDDSTMSDDGTLTINIPSQSGSATITGQVTGSPYQEITKIHVGGNIGSSAIEHGTLNIELPSGGGSGGSIKGQVNNDPDADISKIQITGDVNESVITGDTFRINMKSPRAQIGSGLKSVVDEIKVSGNYGSSALTDKVLTLDLPKVTGLVGSTGAASDIESIQILGYTTDSTIEDKTLKISIPSGGGGTGSDTIQGKIENEDPKQIKTVQIIGSVSGSQIAHETMTINIPRPLVVNAQIDDAEKKAINNIKITGNNTTSHVVDGTLTIDLPADAGGTPTPLKGQVGESGTEGNVAKILVKGNVAGSSLSSNVLTIDVPSIPPSASEYYVGAYDDFEELKRAVTNPVEDKSFGYVKETDTDFNTTYYVPFLYTTGGWRTLDVKSYFYYTKRGETTPTQVASIKQNDKITIDSKGEIDLSGLSDTTPEYFRGYFESLSELDGDVPQSERVKNKTYAFVRQDASVTEAGAERQLLMYMWRQTGNQVAPSWQITAPAGSIALVNTDTYKPIFGITKNPMIERNTNGVITIADCTVPKVHGHILDEAGTSIVQDAEFQHLKFHDGYAFTDYDQSSKNLTIHRAQRRLDMGKNPDVDSVGLVDGKYEGSIFLNKNDFNWWGYANKNSTGAKWTRIIHPGMSNQVESLNERFGQHLQKIPDTVSLTQDHPLWKVSGWTYVTQNSQSLPTPLWSKSGGYIQTFVGGELFNPANPQARIQVFYAEDDMVSYKRNWGTVNNQWTPWVKISFNPGDLSVHNNDPLAHRASHKYYKVLSFGCKYADIKAPTAGIAYFIPFKDYNLLASSDGDHINDGDPCIVPYDGEFRVRGHIGFRGIDQTKTLSVSGEWFVTLERKERSGTAYHTLMKAKYPHHSTSIHEPHLKWDFEKVTLEKGDKIAFTIYFVPTTAGHDITKDFPDIGFHHLRSYVAIDTPGSDAGSAIGESHRKLMGAFVTEGDGGMFIKETGVGTKKYVATTEWIDPDIFSMTNEKV